MHRIFFGLVDERNQLVGTVLAHHEVDGLVLREYDGLEFQVEFLGHLQVALDAVFLFPAVLLATQDERHGFGAACLELEQVALREFLVHRGNDARDAGEVRGQRVKESFDDNRLVVFGLDVERNVARARSKGDVRMAPAVVFHEPSVNGMDEALGVAGRNGNARFVVGLEVVEVETDLVAFDAGEHAVAHERFGVAAVVAEAVELRLADAPAAAGKVLRRRRALAGRPVAVAYEAFEDFRFFAADFLDPRMFILQRIGSVGFERTQEFERLGACLGFFHAVEAAAHHELDQVAFAAALQTAVAPVTKRVVEEQRSLFGRVEWAASDKVTTPAAQRNAELPRMGLGTHDPCTFLI